MWKRKVQIFLFTWDLNFRYKQEIYVLCVLNNNIACSSMFTDQGT